MLCEIPEHAFMLKIVGMHLALLVGHLGIEEVVKEINDAVFLVGYWTLDDVARFMWSGEKPCDYEILCNAVLEMATL